MGPSRSPGPLRDVHVLALAPVLYKVYNTVFHHVYAYLYVRDILSSKFSLWIKKQVNCLCFSLLAYVWETSAFWDMFAKAGNGICS